MTTNSIRGFFEQEHTEIDALIAKVDCGLPGEALPRFQEFEHRKVELLPPVEQHEVDRTV